MKKSIFQELVEESIVLLKNEEQILPLKEKNVLDDKLREASQEFYRRYSNLYNVNQFLESRR